MQITASKPDQEAPKQFKKYLPVRANKTEPPHFLLHYWQDQRQITTITENRIFVTLPKVIEVIKREILKQLATELRFNHKKAGPKFYLQQIISSCSCSSISIQTFYSNVAVLALYYAPML